MSKIQNPLAAAFGGVLISWATVAVSGDSLPLPEPAFTGKVGRTFRDSETPKSAQPMRPPKGAPNIVVVLLDDAGFGQYEAFGGAVPSPAMNRLAQEGLRFNRFHTAGICSPTRAALLTGRNPHKAGVGIVTELSTGYEGYTGVIPRSTVPVARVLRDNGYATAMFGKNHNTPTIETGPAGPFNHWPSAFGFEYFYGFNAWGTSQFQPLLFENSQPVPPRNDPDYHLTRDLADRAIKWVHNVKASDPSRPYFLYIATGATHAPHHAPKAWIENFKGKFDTGWDAYREAAFARQKALGVVPADAKLTPRPAAVPAWNSLPEKTRHLYARQMEVFAGFAAHTDAEMSRVIEAVRSMPDGDNTLVVYIAGDNGASAEGGSEGTLSELARANGLHAQAHVTEAQLDTLGGPKYNNNYPVGWAWAVNSPFKYYKQVVSHLGAIRNPMIMSWPARITAKGGLRTQFINVTDIAPTLLAASGLSAPKRVDGVAQKPMDGVSLLPVMTDAPDKAVRTRQYFEVFGNRAIYDRGWMVSARLADPWLSSRAHLDPDKAQWELYDLERDFTQADDLAAKYPERLKQFEALWWAEAKRNKVLPLDWRAGERMASRARIDPRSKLVFYPGTSAIPEVIAPNIRNRSWTLTARGVFNPDDQGVLITQGGFTGGWSFYLRDGRPTFDYNLSIPGMFHIVADSPVLPGTRTITAKFEYDQGPAPNRGRGGTLTLYADDRQVASGRLDRTLPSLFSLNEGLDVGADFGSPAGDYSLPYAFSGTLKEVQVDLR